MSQKLELSIGRAWLPEAREVQDALPSAGEIHDGHCILGQKGVLRFHSRQILFNAPIQNIQRKTGVLVNNSIPN